MTMKAKLALLQKLIDDRDELTRLKCEAILRGETSIADCPECMKAQTKWDKLYERFVKAIS